jgi:hypothetical protein
MTRLNLEVSPKMDELLTELAREKSTTKADVLRRAVALYNYVETQLAAGDRTLAIAQNDRVIKDIVVP